MQPEKGKGRRVGTEPAVTGEGMMKGKGKHDHYNGGREKPREKHLEVPRPHLQKREGKSGNSVE